MAQYDFFKIIILASHSLENELEGNTGGNIASKL